MNFIQENGEGLSNSVTYVSYTDVVGYAMKDFFYYEWFYKDDDCVFSKKEVERAGATASKLIDSLCWKGRRSNSMQNMEWPRCGAHSDCYYGACAPSNIIPKEIMESTIIMTLLILKGEVVSGTNQTPAKVKSLSLDKMSIEFKDGAYIDPNAGSCGGGMNTTSSDKFYSVRHLIDCYLSRSSSSKSVNVKFKRTL